MLDLDLNDYFDESISVNEPLENYANSLDGSENPDVVTENFNTFIEALPFERSPTDPFESIIVFVLLAFFHCGAINISEQKIKLVMLMLRVLFKIKEGNPDIQLPTTDYILNYEKKKKTRIPKMTPDRYVVRNRKNEEHAFFMNKPSTYLKFLMSNPVKNPMLSSFPDETTGEYNRLQQGSKWKHDPMFQNPMVTLANSNDIWVGDLVEIHRPDGLVPTFLLVTRFFQSREDSSNYVTYAQGYLAQEFAYVHGEGCMSRLQVALPLMQLTSKVPVKKSEFLNIINGRQFDVVNPLDINRNFDLMYCQEPHNDFRNIAALWNDLGSAEKWKRKQIGNTRELMKVVIAPLILFTDDTSGNLSKQYNLFDSYLMTPAAMSYDARSSKNNSYFVCATNKKLSSIDVLPPLVDDLLELEKGVMMYSIAHNQIVLVVAPLLLIQADNYRHSELSMHKGSAAGYFCRKCIICQTKNPNPKPRKNATEASRVEMNIALMTPNELPCISHNYVARQLVDLYRLRDTDDVTVIEQMGKEGYTKNGSEQLLRLESYNPLLDTPVELLHTLPLGVRKALIQFLLKTTLTAAQLTILQTALTEHRQCKAYARSFRSLVNHNGSFLGRDFKILGQILPVIIRDAFPNIVEGDILDLTAKCLESYGSLTSLLYMRSITGNIGSFLELVQSCINELTSRVLDLDNFCIRKKKTVFCILSLQPKLHTLHHLVQDIKRFGMPIHYETEHGEQFNKFIREEILRTNRHNPSRDLAAAFSRQFVLQHLINGGSFLTTVRNAQNNEEIRRVVTVSSGIQQFNREFPDFLKMLLTNRENSDNNDYIESSEDMLVVGTSGMFMDINERSFFGYIDKVERNPVKYYIQNYVLVKHDASIPSSSFCSYESPFFPGYLTTRDNNLVLKRVSQTILRPEDVVLKMRLDMHRKIRVERLGNECRLLNIHKFGSLWALLELISR
ncbi:hypothetical protein G6F56_007290 [Rhizopus delemar]|nr:hypothetical protein G6F56_007290 [Rhizopus delemar]